MLLSFSPKKPLQIVAAGLLMLVGWILADLIVQKVHGSNVQVVAGSGTCDAPNFCIATVIVSASDIANLNGTPKTIIAAPGVGKYLLPIFAVSTAFSPGATAYTDYSNNAGVLDLFYGTTNANDGSTSGVLDESNLTFSALTDNADSFLNTSATNNNSGVAAANFFNFPIIFQTTAGSLGRATSAAVALAGTGYANGNQVRTAAECLGTPATFTITSVGGGGAVTGVALLTGGTGCVPGTDDTVAITGVGTGFKVNIPTIQSFSGGDGTIKVTVPYTVVSVP